MNSPFNPPSRSGPNSPLLPPYFVAPARLYCPSAPKPGPSSSRIDLHIFRRMATTHAESTPNPNSLKFTADEGRFLEEGMISVSSAESAEEHDLARRLFSLSGVEDVFITPEFVTVTKQAAADWTHTKPKIETILQEHLEEQ